MRVGCSLTTTLSKQLSLVRYLFLLSKHFHSQKLVLWIAGFQKDPETECNSCVLIDREVSTMRFMLYHPLSALSFASCC